MDNLNKKNKPQSKERKKERKKDIVLTIITDTDCDFFDIVTKVNKNLRRNEKAKKEIQ